MQDSNPRRLFTRQELFPVELIRPECSTPGGNRTRDPHVISVPHLPSVRPAPAHLVVPTAGFEPTPFRFRRPALCPLSYAGYARCVPF